MLLMGSQAAKLRGDLPAWSDPDLTDYDVVGSRGEFIALRDLALRAHPRTIAHARPYRRFGLRIPLSDTPGDRILIDWVSDEIESSKLLMALDDHTDGVVFGRHCRVVSAVTELGIKRAILQFQADPAKTLAWIEHWEEVVDDDTLSPAHQAFVDQMVAEYQAAREDSARRLSPE